MKTVARVVSAVLAATWPKRIALIRKIPEQFGVAQHADVFSEIAEHAYVPHLTADFGYSGRSWNAGVP